MPLGGVWPFSAVASAGGSEVKSLTGAGAALPLDAARLVETWRPCLVFGWKTKSDWIVQL